MNSSVLYAPSLIRLVRVLNSQTSSYNYIDMTKDKWAEQGYVEWSTRLRLLQYNKKSRWCGPNIRVVIPVRKIALDRKIAYDEGLVAGGNIVVAERTRVSKIQQNYNYENNKYKPIIQELYTIELPPKSSSGELYNAIMTLREATGRPMEKPWWNKHKNYMLNDHLTYLISQIS